MSNALRCLSAVCLCRHTTLLFPCNAVAPPPSFHMGMFTGLLCPAAVAAPLVSCMGFGVAGQDPAASVTQPSALCVRIQPSALGAPRLPSQHLSPSPSSLGVASCGSGDPAVMVRAEAAPPRGCGAVHRAWPVVRAPTTVNRDCARGAIAQPGCVRWGLNIFIPDLQCFAFDSTSSRRREHPTGTSVAT